MSTAASRCGRWRTAGIAMLVLGTTTTRREKGTTSVALAASSSSSAASQPSYGEERWSGSDSSSLPPPPPPPTTSSFYNEQDNEDAYLNQQMGDGDYSQSWSPQQQQGQERPFSDSVYNAPRRRGQDYDRYAQEDNQRWMEGREIPRGWRQEQQQQQGRGYWQGEGEEEALEKKDGGSRRWLFGGRSSKSNDADKNRRGMQPSGGPGSSRRPVRPPIHYQFPQSQEFAQQQEQEPQEGDNENKEGLPKYATARKDAVTRYISNHRLGRFHICFMSTVFGYYLGSFLAQSLGWGPSGKEPITVWEIYGSYLKTTFATLFSIWTFLRNDYGEMSRAIGLGMIFLLGTVHSVRRRYPSLRHVASLLGAAPRRPFPPPRHDDGPPPPNANDLASFYRRADPSYSPRAVLLAMIVVGGICGSEFVAPVPLLPKWMGALGGAVVLAGATTLPRNGALGDLLRCMGMRVVCLVQQVLEYNRQLQVVSKAGVVGGHLLDRAMILDRQHNIRQRLAALLQWIYGKVVQIVTQLRLSTSVADDAQEEQEQEDTRDNWNVRQGDAGGGGRGYNGPNGGPRYNSGRGNY